LEHTGLHEQLSAGKIDHGAIAADAWTKYDRWIAHGDLP
jgi:hypothetical protein